MKAKWLYLLFVATMVVSLLVGCKPGGGEDEIRIGIIEDLSGPTAAWGEGLFNGATLAVEDINAKGGLLKKKVRLIPYDFKGKVPEALTAYNRLVDQDKVVAVIGAPNSAVHIALAPVADEKKVPIVGDPMDERATTPAPGEVYAYTFLGEPSCMDQAYAIASYGLYELGYKNVAILYNQGNPYAVSLAAPFAEYYMRHGGNIVANEPFQSGTNDFRPQLTKIKQLNPDALHITNYLKENALILNQMRELGMDIPVLGNNSCHVPLAETAGEAANGVVYPNNVAMDDPRHQDAIQRYKDKFGKDPVVHFWQGYDDMMLIANAIEVAGKLDPTAIRDALENHSVEVECLTGKITLSPATHRPVNLPLAILRIENSEYVTLETQYLPVIK